VFYPPEQPSQEISKKDGNPDENGPMNTNAYVIIKDYKINHRYDGYPLSKFNFM